MGEVIGWWRAGISLRSQSQNKTEGAKQGVGATDQIKIHMDSTRICANNLKNMERHQARITFFKSYLRDLIKCGILLVSWPYNMLVTNLEQVE